MASCPVRAEQVLESHGRPLRITLSRPSDCAKYEITLDVALHFGPEDHSCAEKLNKNNDQVGRETLQLFKSGVTTVPLGKAARATRAVSAGISPTGSGRKLMDHPCVGWQTEFADGISVSSTYQRRPPCRAGAAADRRPGRG